MRQAGAAVFDCLIEKGPVPCDRLPVNHWHLGPLVSVSGGRTPDAASNPQWVLGGIWHVSHRRAAVHCNAVQCQCDEGATTHCQRRRQHQHQHQRKCGWVQRSGVEWAAAVIRVTSVPLLLLLHQHGRRRFGGAATDTEYFYCSVPATTVLVVLQ